MIRIGFYSWQNFTCGMTLTYLSIVYVKLLEDVFQIMRLGISCLFIVIRPMEGTLVGKQLQLKYLV